MRGPVPKKKGEGYVHSTNFHPLLTKSGSVFWILASVFTSAHHDPPSTRFSAKDQSGSNHSPDFVTRFPFSCLEFPSTLFFLHRQLAVPHFALSVKRSKPLQAGIRQAGAYPRRQYTAGRRHVFSIKRVKRAYRKTPLGKSPHKVVRGRFSFRHSSPVLLVCKRQRR